MNDTEKKIEWFKQMNPQKFNEAYRTPPERTAAIIGLILGPHATKKNAVQYIHTSKDIQMQLGVNSREITAASNVYKRTFLCMNDEENSNTPEPPRKITRVSSESDFTTTTVAALNTPHTHASQVCDNSQIHTETIVNTAASDTDSINVTVSSTNSWHTITVNSEVYSVLKRYSRTLGVSFNTVIHQMIIDHKMIDSMQPRLVNQYKNRVSESIEDTMDTSNDSDVDESGDVISSDNQTVIESEIHSVIGAKVINDDIAVERTKAGSVIPSLPSVSEYNAHLKAMIDKILEHKLLYSLMKDEDAIGLAWDLPRFIQLELSNKTKVLKLLPHVISDYEHDKRRLEAHSLNKHVTALRHCEFKEQSCTANDVPCHNILTVNILMCIADDTTTTRNNNSSMDIFSYNYTDEPDALSLQSLRLLAMTNEPACTELLSKVYDTKLNEQIVTASNSYIVLTLTEEETRSLGYSRAKGTTKLRLRPVMTICSDEVGMRYMISVGDENCSMWFEMKNEERADEFRADRDITRHNNVKPFDEIPKAECDLDTLLGLFEHPDRIPAFHFNCRTSDANDLLCSMDPFRDITPDINPHGILIALGGRYNFKFLDKVIDLVLYSATEKETKKIKLYHDLCQLGIFQRSDIFDTTDPKKLALHSDRLKPNGNKARSLFEKWGQIKKHLHDLAMEHGEPGVESMIQLLEKSIHTVHELHKLLTKSGLLIIDDIRRVAKLIDTISIMVAHLSPIVKRFPRYIAHLRIIIWYLILKGTVSRDSMTTKELLNKYAKLIFEFNTTHGSSANIRKLSIPKYLQPDETVDNTATLNTVLQVFVSLSLYIACDTFSQLMTEDFKLAGTEPVEEHLKKKLLAVTDHKLSSPTRRREYNPDILAKKYTSQRRIYNQVESTVETILSHPLFHRSGKYNELTVEEGSLVVCNEIQSVLQDHQRVALNVLYTDTLCCNKSKIVTWRMGLGKSLLMILYSHLCVTTDNAKIVIVCPVTLTRNWLREFEKWITQMNLEPIFIKVLNCRSWNAVKYESTISRWAKDGGVIILNPAMVVPLLEETSTDALSIHLVTKGVHTVICDEAHDYLSTETQEYESLLKIMTDRVVLLTGTVFRETGKSLDNMLRLVSSKQSKSKPKYKHSMLQYQAMYSEFIKPDTMHNMTVRNRQAVIQDVVQYVKEDRSTIQKSDVFISLPDDAGMTNWSKKHEFLVYVEMTSEQSQMYNEKFDNEELTDFSFSSQPGNCVKYVKAKKVLGHPALENLALIPSVDQSQKLQFLWHIIHHCKCYQEKVIVASTSKQTLLYYKDLLLQLKHLKHHNISLIHGDVSEFGRMNAVKQFSNDGFSVLFMTVDTGGLGLNLQCCHRIVLLEPVYDNVQVAQLVGRCHRNGQQKDVYFYQIITRRTQEEEVFERCMKRKILQDLMMSTIIPNISHYNLRYNPDEMPCIDPSSLTDEVVKAALDDYRISSPCVVSLTHAVQHHQEKPGKKSVKKPVKSTVR